MFNKMTSGLRGDGSTSIGRLGSQRCDAGTRCAGPLSRLPLVSRLCRLLRLAPPPPPLPPTPALAPARPPCAAGAQMGSARRRERGWQRAHETVCVGAGLVHGPHRMPRLVRALPRRQHASAERFGQGRSAAQLRGQRSAQSVAVPIVTAAALWEARDRCVATPCRLADISSSRKLPSFPSCAGTVPERLMLTWRGEAATREESPRLAEIGRVALTSQSERSSESSPSPVGKVPESLVLAKEAASSLS